MAARSKALGLQNYLSLDHRCIHLGAATTSAPSQSSYTIMKAGIDSSRYYVEHYSGASWPMRSLHRLSCLFYQTLFRIQKALGIRRRK